MKSTTMLTVVLMAFAFGAQARDIPRAQWERCRAVADTGVRLSCYDGLSASTAPIPKSTPPATRGNAQAEDNRFGARPVDDEPSQITSQTAADFDGWSNGSSLRLANGQLWIVTDSSQADLRPGARTVRIERTVFGDYRLVVQGVNTAPKVRRLE